MGSLNVQSGKSEFIVPYNGTISEIGQTVNRCVSYKKAAIMVAV